MPSDINRPVFYTGIFSIPVEERIRFYYILGHNADDIQRAVSNEFQEFEMHPISVKNIKQFIAANKKALMEARQEHAMAIRAKLSEELSANFSVAQHTEIKIVKAYCKKIDELIEQLAELDVEEKDENGYFKNMGQYATLVMSINKTHETIEKLSGTAAAREVLTHMKKAYAKEMAAKGSGMHASAREMEVTFMDNPDEFHAFGPNFESKELPTLRKING